MNAIRNNWAKVPSKEVKLALWLSILKAL
jgi:hypothetical protein